MSETSEAENRPEPRPERYGTLDVGDGNLVYWEAWGAPEGKPVLIVHGGPGAGARPGRPRGWDLERCRVIVFDQRGCGRSTPHASDPAADMSVNTTHHLIADMERLRAHLGIERWLLFGGSWGSTLILAYAERYPQRVSEIVIPSVTTTRRSEVAWLYGGVGRFIPQAYDRFRAGVPRAEQDGDLVAAYCRLMENPDPQIRAQAAVDWLAWEDAIIALEPNNRPGAYSDRPGPAQIAFVRICAHYFSNGAWLEEGELIRNAGRLAGIPGALVHGRFDMGGPVTTAWELAKAWPDADLRIIEDAGHMGSDAFRDALNAAVDRFTR